MKRYQLAILAVVFLATLGYGFKVLYDRGTARAYSAGYASVPQGVSKPLYQAAIDTSYKQYNDYNKLVGQYNELRDAYINVVGQAQANVYKPISCSTRLSFSGTMAYTNCY